MNLKRNTHENYLKYTGVCFKENQKKVSDIAIFGTRHRSFGSEVNK